VVNTQKLYAMLTSFIKSPIWKGGRTTVAVSGGDYAIKLDTATVFDVSVTASGTLTFSANDPTKVYTFQMNVTTTGAYSFTSGSMSGVTIYLPTGGSLALTATGRTSIGGTYDGPAATLDLFPVKMT